MATPRDDTDHGLLPGVILVGAVLAILGTGIVLSTDSPTASHRIAPLPSLPPPEAPPAPRAMVPAPDLASRVGEDIRRIGASSGRYTAQLVVACRAETVERLVEAAQGDPSLYVLPAEVKGAACHRVCWGSYATSEDAARAADLPAALRSADRPRAVEIVTVLP